MLLTILRPRSARAQASTMFFARSWPGISGIGTWFTVRRSCVAAMATIPNGARAASKRKEQKYLSQNIDDRSALDHRPAHL
jgi:hypothetical protein